MCKGKHLKRNTIYFKDYLDELNIDYKDANNKVNQLKLQELLDNDKKLWYKDLRN